MTYEKVPGTNPTAAAAAAVSTTAATASGRLLNKLEVSTINNNV